MILPVTKPYLPSFEKYQSLLKEIYDVEWLTNNGPLLVRFESQLKELLKLKYLSLVTNGTIALQLAIKALELKGEVITTPFSYIATTSSLIWEGCKPAFVDIDRASLNIDADLVEGAINENTTAILATHCFGNSCEIDKIESIARKHNLKVIYDAAHCFGSTYKGRSIFEYGDISTLSLHATKIMHSVEGGVVFTSNQDLLDRINYMKNFGHNGYEEFHGIGINGKNSELHSAMGICVLEDMEHILSKRKTQSIFYDKLFENIPALKQEIDSNCGYNYSYYPLIFENEKICTYVQEQMKKKDILLRRYFYPSLNTIDYVNGSYCPHSEDISKRILCFPLFHNLKEENQEFIYKSLSQLF